MTNSPQKISNKIIWNIAYPIILGNMAQAIVSFADTAFLGHVGEVELGASMMAGIYYYVFSTLAWGFAMGAQIIVARRFGEGNLKNIGKVFEHGTYIVFCLGVLLFLLMHIFTNSLLHFTIQQESIYNAAMEYMKYRHYGIFFVCFNFLFRSLFVGLSNTKAITYSTILMGGINVVLDYAMIFGHFGFSPMGVGGAALASVIAEVSALIFFVIYTLRVLPYKKYDIFKFQKFEMSMVTSMLKLSMPTMLQRLFSFGTWYIFFIMIERMGERALAVSGVVRSVYMLILIPVFAFGATANTLTSRLIGEGRQNDIKPTLRRTVQISLCTIVPMILLCLFVPETIASIYTDNVGLASDSGNSLFVICIAAVCMVFGITYFEAVSGTGNTISALWLESIVLFMYITFIWLLVNFIHPNIAWVWSCEIVYASMIGLFSVIYLNKANWQKKKI